MSTTHIEKKVVKAWAFMQDSPKGKMFIADLNDCTDVFLKKPKARTNPFDYSRNPKLTWKPTPIEIHYPAHPYSAIGTDKCLRCKKPM